MVSQTLTIARNTFLESVRQPIYFILTAICGLAVLFTYWTAAFSMDYSSSAEVSADNKVALDIALATVFVCATLLSAFLATAVISKEIDRKTVLTVVSKPVARPTVVVGKYLGVTGAIMIAVTSMLLFVLLGVRHEVMSTAADDLDAPVITFTILAVFGACAIGAWCNFFYGWSFTQAATLLLCPFLALAFVGVLMIGKKWSLQPISHDFKPEVTKAAFCLLAAVLVLTSIATATSARLGQVMTLMICAGVFVLGLMSNHFIGAHAIDNTFIAQIDKAVPRLEGHTDFTQPEDTYDLTLSLEPRTTLLPGSPIYYGPYPSGYKLNVTPFLPFKGDVNNGSSIADRTKPPAIAVVNITNRKLAIVHTGPAGPPVVRPPAPGDYLFLQPTKYNPIAWAAWAVIPNVQFFWLMDAVSQAAPIPFPHVGLIILYAFAQAGIFLSLAVALFQTREVG
jgi:hypothetical protein